MQTITETFRLIAMDETEFWEPHNPELKEDRIFGIYIFRPGERTHICSLTPSSWCEFVENRFTVELDKPDLSDAARHEIEELQFHNSGQPGDYFGYIGEDRDPRTMSAPFEIEVDCEDDADKDDIHRAIWDAAREAVTTGEVSNCLPVDDWQVRRDMLRERAPKVIPTLPLFSGRPDHA